MTLTLALVATDGFLALADGLRIKYIPKTSTHEVLANDDVKMVAVPHVSAVVLTSGRATFNGLHVSVLLERALAALEGPRLLDEIAELCKATIDAAHSDCFSPNSTRLLVVGYNEQPSLRAFHVDVPPRDFGDGLQSVREVPIDPELPLIANPADSESGALIVTEFDQYSDFLDELIPEPPDTRNAYRLSGLPLTELRPTAIDMITTWLTANSTLARADGVGGLWSMAEVRPDQPVTVETRIRLSGSPYGDTHPEGTEG